MNSSVIKSLGRALNGERMRYDPNCALSLGDAIEFGRAIEGMNNDYYEDPVWGMPQLARLKEFVRIPIATNTVVVNFEQLAANVAQRAVDVVLARHHFLGWHSALHQSGRHLRDLRYRRCGAFVGRTGRAIGEHVAHGRGGAESWLCG